MTNSWNWKLTRVLRINIYIYYLFRYIVKLTNEFKVKNIILIINSFERKRIINNIGKF